MKDKVQLQQEIDALRKRFVGEVLYIANPDFMNVPRYVKTTTKAHATFTEAIDEAQWLAACADPTSEKIKIPKLNPSLAGLGSYNLCVWMEEAEWTAIVNAILAKEPLPKATGTFLSKYLNNLPRTELRRFITKVDAARDKGESTLSSKEPR